MLRDADERTQAAIRRRDPRPEYVDAEAVQPSFASDVEYRAMLAWVMARLPPMQAEVFGYLADGHCQVEAARLAGITAGRVSQIMPRIREQVTAYRSL
jgi:DNA-directed RNA polymerase specialized sigma24 family protein